MSKFQNKTLKELREMAKELQIVGIYQLGKEELIEAISTTEAEKAAKANQAKTQNGIQVKDI